MKRVNFDFDNIGGLSKVFAIPPDSFVRIRTDYVDNTKSLELRRRENIIEIPIYADDTFSYTEEQLDSDAGDGYSILIEGVIPKHSNINNKVVEDLERGVWLILTEDNNGVVRLSGDDNVKLKFISNKTTGKKATIRNGISFTLQCVQEDPSVLITVEDIKLI